MVVMDVRSQSDDNNVPEALSAVSTRKWGSEWGFGRTFRLRYDYGSAVIIFFTFMSIS